MIDDATTPVAEGLSEPDRLRRGGDREQQGGAVPSAATAEQAVGDAGMDLALFEMLIARVEQLSRELGRAEGRQIALERHVARLEEQFGRLRQQQQTRGQEHGQDHTADSGEPRNTAPPDAV